jgi:peptide/nickel transport system substrate-binding protein
MTRTVARPARALIAAVAAALLLTGCSSAPSSGADGSGGSDPAVIRWAATLPQGNWDPVVTGATGASLQLGTIYEPLLTEKDGKPAPGLVESWEYNGDGTAVTFTLRDGLTFHDGSPVDAEAAAFYFTRAKTQENSALLGSYSNIDTVTADSELDFTVHLKSVDYQVPYLLSIRAGFLTSQEATATPEAAAALNSRLPIGAGPFEVVEYVPESHITLEKFEGYWNAENIHIDRIEISFGVDASSVVSGIQTGVYNFSQVAGAQIQEARDAGLDLVSDISTNWGVQFLNVNRKVEPFTDERVVQAFQYAIDQQAFVDGVLLGEGEVTHQIVPSEHAAFNQDLESAFGYDPDKAEELLAEAGYADGLEVTLSPSPYQGSAYAELVQAQLADVGVTVTIDNDPNWAQGYFAKETAFSLYGWVGRNSPTQLLTEHFDVNGVLNLSSPYTTEEFQAAIADLRATPIDDPSFPDKVRAANEIGFLDGSVIPLTASATTWVKTSDISSDFQNGQGWLNWTGVTVGD